MFLVSLPRPSQFPQSCLAILSQQQDRLAANQRFAGLEQQLLKHSVWK
jgi:hypothetical protein